MRWAFRRSALAVLAVLLVAGTGCDDFDELEDELEQLRADHNDLEARHMRLIQRLVTWTDPAGPDTESVQAWLTNVGDAICDIVAKNGPPTKYATGTRDFCADSDPPADDPPDPPDWGAD